MEDLKEKYNEILQNTINKSKSFLQGFNSKEETNKLKEKIILLKNSYENFKFFEENLEKMFEKGFNEYNEEIMVKKKFFLHFFLTDFTHFFFFYTFFFLGIVQSPNFFEVYI